MKVFYKPTFIRQYNKLDDNLKAEVLEKIELFKDKENHKSLKVHKLNGKLKDCYSFYVNYKFRIVFIWQGKDVAFLVIGDHNIYN